VWGSLKLLVGVVLGFVDRRQVVFGDGFAGLVDRESSRGHRSLIVGSERDRQTLPPSRIAGRLPERAVVEQRAVVCSLSVPAVQLKRGYADERT
jgi:hypothetical protein